jgi:uncharacterized phage protein (TIGR01671 family)
MPREIKFRAWNPTVKKFTYFEGINLVESILETGIFLGFKAQNAVYISAYNEPQQYIGIFDKNGKEIYEGDIIKTKGEVNSKVLWGTGGFYGEEINGWDTMTKYYTLDIGNVVNSEIIGNIYENPELFEALK